MVRNCFFGVLLLAAAVSFASCGGNTTPNNTNANANTAQAEKAADAQKSTCDGQKACENKCLVGKYTGKVPGADHASSAYTLVFEKGGAVSVTCVVENSNQAPTLEKGTFEFENGDKNKIVCKLADHSMRFVRQENGNLVMVNDQWEMPEMPESYTLSPVQE